MGKAATPRALQRQRGQGRRPHAARQSPQKLNLVAASSSAARRSRRRSPISSSRASASLATCKKCLESAIANAENNHDLDVDDLVVSQAFVGKALVMKRFHARARGRGARILKPFSNLTIVVRGSPPKQA